MLEYFQQQIQKASHRRISYAQYIETALYHPTEGYYMKPKQKLGKAGDFYTSMHVNDIFPVMFVKVFARFFKESALKPFICEVGGGDGRFAKACLEEWDKHYSDTYGPLTYVLIETSPYHRELQEEKLKGFSNVSIYPNLEEVKQEFETLKGIFFSNELFDALPVHVVEQRNGELMEVFVTTDGEHLTETMARCDDDAVLKWMKAHIGTLEEGQRIEVPLAMEEMLRAYSEWFEEVAMFTVDYGYWKEDWQERSRRKGSLRGYKQHELMDNILQSPGEMDITTHIHLDPFISIGEQNELTLLTATRQNEFLLKAGILEELQQNVDPNPFSPTAKRNRAIRSFIMGEGIGAAFHVIVQKKGLQKLEISDLLEAQKGYTLFEQAKK